MTRLSAILAGVAGCLVPAVLMAQDVRDIRITGANELSVEIVREAARIESGAPLPPDPGALEAVAERVVRRYKDEGYTFASAAAAFDAATGVLSLSIDEGVIDGVEFTGVDDRLERIFAEEFALRAGDVFQQRRARQALEVLLRPTRGSVTPGRIFERGGSFTDSRELGNRRSDDRRGAFDLVDRGGDRILLVGLRQAAGRFKVVPDMGDREDWFTSVDGFVPSLGFGAAVFDHSSFNHTYVSGHFSYKAARDQVGYAVGVERPFFTNRKLFISAEVHDLTASDDRWQVSSLEASLAAAAARRSYRDYYMRRGGQLTGALRLRPHVEVFSAWRIEKHETLAVESEFSIWNRDEAFRANLGIRNGHEHALIVGATIDSSSFDYESLDATYRRHQLDTLFGTLLNEAPRKDDPIPVWRIDWTSELSPARFGGDFDFSRHIVSARYRKLLTRRQEVGVRAIRGWSGGLPPPQRLFAIGGLGSVHGYDFKQAGGGSMTLLNAEYALGWRDGIRLIGFYDAGRIESTPWLKGIGWGIGLGGFRVDFGYRTDDFPGSLRVVMRFGPTF